MAARQLRSADPVAERRRRLAESAPPLAPEDIDLLRALLPGMRRQRSHREAA